MKGDEVVKEKLETFVRRTLKVKKADKVEIGVQYVTLALTEMVAHDFVESSLNPAVLGNYIAGGGWSTFSREIRKLGQVIWQESRTTIFASFYRAPRVEEILCVLAAEMVTRPDLLRRRGMEMENHSERTARTEIARYIRPETVQSQTLLAAYIFMIDACEGALSGAKRGAIYTRELRNSAGPHVSAKAVTALFKAQKDWWKIDNGKMFGRELPRPTPSMLYYHIRTCMVEQEKRRKMQVQ